MTPTEIEIEGMRLVAPAAQTGSRPLLAQCASLLDSLLGGPVASGGIIDEIRRVRAELKKEGY